MQVADVWSLGVTNEGVGDGKEKGKTPQIQRSVAFDLSTTDEKSVELSSPIPIRRVTIR